MTSEAKTLLHEFLHRCARERKNPDLEVYRVILKRPYDGLVLQRFLADPKIRAEFRLSSRKEAL